MQKLYYQFPETWFGDCMPFGHGDKFYLYHQRDTRKPGPFGEPFGWDLATTSDFVHYEDCGVAIPRGTDEEQDQFIFAGSVFEAEGQYHIFYTGYNRDYPALGKPSQVLMHAYSDDLVTWHKTQDALTFTPQEGYDPDDWRDPWVIRDEENDQYLLVLGTRLQGPKTRQTGRTVKFTSKDLKNWKFEGDFWAPDLYTMHEMPDLFKIGDWWYHIVTEYSDRSKMVYRIQKIPQEIHDAALIDGASSVKKFWYITLPMSKESMLVTALITTIGSYKIFTEIQILTGGGPGRAKGGQLLVTKDGLCHKGQAKLIQAVDTMGAGDSFFAAFLVTLLKEGWTKDGIITESMIEVAFAAAADFSGRNCLREGSFGMGLSIEM